MLAGLDAELAASSRRRGLLRPMRWSTAEAVLRSMIADQIDRKVELQRRWISAADDQLRVKLSAEIRLLEAAVAGKLAQIKTDLPAPPSRTSEKARQAQNTRWEQERARTR